MNIYVQPSFYQERPIPPRVRAAMEFITSAAQPFTSCEGEIKVRKLAPREQATYDAALEALRLYFASEMDFGDVPAAPTGAGGSIFTADGPINAEIVPPPPPPAPPPPPFPPTA